MGNLEGTRAYLCGPVEFDSKANTWRDRIVPDLEDLGVIIFNPLDKRKWMTSYEFDASDQASLKESVETYKNSIDWGLGQWKMVQKNREMRAICKALANRSDFIICRLTKTFTVGTFEELSDARNQNKPILFWCPDERVPSMWLFDQFCESNPDGIDETFFREWEDLYYYLNKIDNDSTKLNRIRWIYPSWRKDASANN